jgi:Leucine-rich repeat (LRR) protein
MDTSPDDPTPPAPLGAAIGCVSNAGAQRFLLEAESTTGYVAWRTADGTTLISNAQQVSIAATPYLIFWACAGYEDTTPDGRIVSFDCHDNALTRLDVQALTGLEYLDCSFNQLRDLALAGLLELQGLDADNNQLATLDVRGLPALRVLNCACNRLQTLDLSGLDLLAILDCSGNQLVSLCVQGCAALQDCKSTGNPLELTARPS